MVALNFNANEVKPNTFEPLPAGEYIAAIVSSEMKPTKKNDGEYAEFKFEILEGEYKGRTLFSRLNLKNPNEKAVQIARGELSAICHAVGVLTPRDTVDLHNIPMRIKVACKKNPENDQINNEIKGYKSKATSQQMAAAVTGGTPAAAAGGAAPWSR